MSADFDIWIARCKPGAGQTETPTAAVWANTAELCEQTLRRAVLDRGLEWIGLDEALPLEDLAEEDRAHLPLDGLKDTLGPETPVVFRRGQFRKRKTGGHWAVALPFAKPLDDQMEVFPPLSVPEDLDPHLFPEDQTTFAILDAAQIVGLPETLEMSGMRHQILYTGQLGEEMRDHAPYLVELDKEHRLMRYLMTEGDGPTELWEQDYGIFVLSRLSFDDLYAHFRKFTTVAEEGGGTRIFMRFWSDAVMRAFALHSAPDALISEFLAPCRIIYRDIHRVSGPAVFMLSLEGVDG